VKTSRAETAARFHCLPEIRFELQALTPYGGLVLLQRLFERIGLKSALERCFAHRNAEAIFGHHVIFMWLIVHLMLGHRRLRDRDFYAEDPLVQRVLGLRRLPDVATISRSLRDADERCVQALSGWARQAVIDRIAQERIARVTLDFDGSVLSTKAHAEGTAVGFNRKHRGARSYYPLYCTVAQTAQFLGCLHRPGNVHDSRGARQFIRECIEAVRTRQPRAVIEARLDSAFFDGALFEELRAQRVQFTASVPFERLVHLKRIIERRQRWRTIDPQWQYFEVRWKPKSWPRRLRVLCVRQLTAERSRGPLQLDLFEPCEPQARFTAIVTNRRGRAKSILAFHHGRGSQEGLFAEAKSHAQMGYIPVRSLQGNRLFHHAALLAHNLTKELQMQTQPPDRGTRSARPALWSFLSLHTFRSRFLLRAARLTRPQNRLTLTMNTNDAVQAAIERMLRALDPNPA
jgi:hypothetical protein